MRIMKLKKLLLILTISTFIPSINAEELSIACGAVGAERQYCIDSVNQWSEKTGHTVNVLRTPDSSSERLVMYQMLLREKHDTVDVFQIDVVWPGLLGKYLLDLSKYIPKKDINAHSASLITNNTIDGRLVAMPWYVDIGLLYYRKDLLKKYDFEPPRTWEEMGKISAAIKRGEGNNELAGYLFQADNYEGLTCNVMEWFGSTGNSETINKDGVQFVTPENAQVAELIRQFLIDGISPSSLLHEREEDVRKTFQEGNAIFMRNWPYAWNLLLDSSQSAVAGKVGVTVLPGAKNGVRGAGTLGGWQLSVTRYSKHPDLAADLVNFMTSEAEQRDRLTKGYFPTRNALYQEAPPTDIEPLFAAVGQALEHSVARPANALERYYKNISRVIYTDTNGFLEDTSISGVEYLKNMEEEISRIIVNLKD
jgi:trehalose/maltose transport system substrate-binding protein